MSYRTATVGFKGLIPRSKSRSILRLLTGCISCPP